MKTSFDLHKVIFKATDFALLLTLSCFIVTAVYTFGYGSDVILGKTSTKEVVVDYAFVRLVGGKPSNRSLGIKQYGLSCRQGGQDFCDTYTHGNAVIAKNVKFIIINDTYSSFQYGEFISKKGNFVIDNRAENADTIAKGMIEEMQNTLLLFLKISLFFLFNFIILKFLTKHLEKNK